MSGVCFPGGDALPELLNSAHRSHPKTTVVFRWETTLLGKICWTA